MCRDLRIGESVAIREGEVAKCCMGLAFLARLAGMLAISLHNGGFWPQSSQGVGCMRSVLARSVDIVLVVCALVVTTAVTRRFLFESSANQGITNFKGWREDLSFSRRIGSANARYRMVVWTDYQCPACKQFEKEIDSARLELKDSLTVVYRYFPLAMHPLALRAAIAAECARSQGRFEQMHRALFQRDLVGDSLPTESLIQAANVPNAALFRTCLSDSSGTAQKAVRLDMARGQTLRLGGTPGVQIGDHLATGAIFTTALVSALRGAGAIGLASATPR